MSLQNSCSDIVHNIMDYMDIKELNTTSKLCKNLKNDSETFSIKIKKEINLETLTNKYTCRYCDEKSYDVSKFCTDCFLHMCHNCYTIRQHMTEFIKIGQFINNVYEYKPVCHDYCVFRCHKCKFFDSNHSLFLNDEIELQSICVNCFVLLNIDDKKKYKECIQNNDEDDWDGLDYTD